MLAHVDAQAAALPDRDRSPQPEPAGDDIAALVAFTRARLDEHEASVRGLLARAQEASLAVQEPGLLGRYIPGWYSWPDVEALCEHALRGVAADRKLLDAYDRATAYRDRVFAQPPPRSVSDEMRAVTQMMCLEQVMRFRAAIWAGHPDFRAGSVK